jgi:pyruvate dehydrogenase E1 component beta subunit
VKTGRVVVVHEAAQTLGLGAEVAARLAERSILFLKAPVVRVTGYDVPPPYPASERMYYPTKERVLDAVKKTLGF